jgi:hypothetical protein
MFIFFRDKSQAKPAAQEPYEPRGIERPDYVDAVMKMPDGSGVLLMCALEAWSGKVEQLQTLIDKFRTYIAFVRSGQFAQQHPEIARKPPRILLRCNYAPTDKAQQVFDFMRKRFLDEDGIQLEVIVKPICADPQA